MPAKPKDKPKEGEEAPDEGEALEESTLASLTSLVKQQSEALTAMSARFDALEKSIPKPETPADAPKEEKPPADNPEVLEALKLIIAEKHGMKDVKGIETIADAMKLRKVLEANKVGVPAPPSLADQNKAGQHDTDKPKPIMSRSFQGAGIT
jgi:hypothetical protein